MYPARSLFTAAASVSLLLAVGSEPLLAQRSAASGGAEVDTSKSAYTATEYLVPTRDGVKLYAVVYRPRQQTVPLPFLLSRTPYGVGGPERPLNPAYQELADDGYLFVFQDIRGRGKSEGRFEMLRPFRDKRDPKAIDESTDTYDSIEWLLKNVPNNNGRVGMHGGSYAGWTVVMGMLDPHPALKAVSPQASPSDMYLGDDFHHNGAFRLSFGFEYSSGMERPQDMAAIERDTPDAFLWYLKLGGLSNVNERLLHGRIPTWNNFVEHPNYDEFWQHQSVEPYLTRVTVPTLNVAGFWDQEDFYGPVTIYRKLEAHDAKNLNFLVLGPWNHGGWLRGSGQKFGSFDFGSATATFFKEQVQKPWFAYWLKDRGKLDLPEALVFESGANEWRREDRWPARNTTSRKLYLHANGKASFSAPEPSNAGEGEFDSFTSDPANPVPYRDRAALAASGRGGWSTWLWEDQRFLKGRPDVLSFTTEPLAEDLVIAGDITANLFVSTDKQDADFVVKLIDGYPENYPDPTLAGYQLMVANDVFRGRFRNSYVKPEPMRPNEIERIKVDLHTQAYRFKRGHRVTVQIQSTWFPLIDRNPQRWVPNIYQAKDADFESATHRVYRSAKAPTHIEFAVRQGS